MRRDALLLTSVVLLAPVPGLAGEDLIERATCKGLTYRVERAALSPDGKVLAAGGGNARGGELRLWDVATSQDLGSLAGSSDSLDALVFSPDGKRLASEGPRGTQVWDVPARKLLAAFNGGGALAFSPDGERLAFGGVDGASVREIASGKLVASFRRRERAHGGVAVFSKDLGTMALPDYEEIGLWDVAAGKQRALLSEHQGQVDRMAYSRDGKTLVTASVLLQGRKARCRGEIRLWDAATGRARAVFQDGLGWARALALSPDGRRLAVLDVGQLPVPGEPSLKLLDVATGRQRRIAPVPGWTFFSLGFSDDGRLFVTGTDDANTVRLWEVVLRKLEEK
jgi:WD40 repeat protein